MQPRCNHEALLDAVIRVLAFEDIEPKFALRFLIAAFNTLKLRGYDWIQPEVQRDILKSQVIYEFRNGQKSLIVLPAMSRSDFSARCILAPQRGIDPKDLDEYAVDLLHIKPADNFVTLWRWLIDLETIEEVNRVVR